MRPFSVPRSLAKNCFIVGSRATLGLPMEQTQTHPELLPHPLQLSLSVGLSCLQWFLAFSKASYSSQGQTHTAPDSSCNIANSDSNYVSSASPALSHSSSSPAEEKRLAPLYRCRNKDLGRLNNLFKVTAKKEQIQHSIYLGPWVLNFIQHLARLPRGRVSPL